MTKSILYSLVTITILVTCRNPNQSKFITYLDSLQQGQIANLYGPPKPNMPFGEDSLIINNTSFDRGLGVHAPSRFRMELHGKAVQFTAFAGVDNVVKKLVDTLQNTNSKVFPNYTYDNRVDHYDPTQGGTVVFKVYTDDELVFQSEKLTAFDDPKHVQIDLKGVRTITLAVDPTDDGSYADHANWAGAAISWKKKPAQLPVIEWYPKAVLVNHVGFMPGSYKTCYFRGTKKTTFTLIDEESGQQVYQGEMSPQSGDLGKYVVGDFSDFKIPGRYYIHVDGSHSAAFNIAEDVYTGALKKHMNYIHQQRSGDPDAGWTKGQHLDDGVRQDNGKHQDVTGGWYDASDLRKPMKGNALLLLALTEIAKADLPGFDKQDLLEEMKWGNKFLFSMQEPEGYVMSYIGSTKNGMMDNRWTDNVIGNADDRTILTDPANISDQLTFVLANARIAQLYSDVEPAYAHKCGQAAKRAWRWTTENQVITSPNDLGLALSASIALYQAYGEENYKKEIFTVANELLSQQKLGDEYLGNHFFTFGEKAKTYSGRWIMMGLQDLTKQFPKHETGIQAKQAITKFAEGYYNTLGKTNAFSIIPWVFATNDLGSGKQIGPYFYRNFLHVGMNQHLSSQGCALIAAYNVSNDKEYLRLGQKQLDWIYGANPFNASSVTGLGFNQPTIFKTLPVEFAPHTPLLSGGVMTGIGSDKNDQIAFFPGWWWTTEYWSPSVTYTMLLVTRLANLK